MNVMTVDQWYFLPEGFKGIAIRQDPYKETCWIQYYYDNGKFIDTLYLGHVFIDQNRSDGLYGFNDESFAEFWRRCYKMAITLGNEDLIEYALAHVLGSR